MTGTCCPDCHDHPHVTGKRPSVPAPQGERKIRLLVTVLVYFAALAAIAGGVTACQRYGDRRDRAARLEVAQKYARVLTACDRIGRTAHEMERSGIALDGDGQALAAWWAEELRLRP